jgi:hypothetical protein
MNEFFLHYLWRHRLFDPLDLSTKGGERVEVLQTGHYNRDAGPDFLEALVRIDGTRWVGSVEMHMRSSEWKQHGHDGDPAYANVILHVVWEHDAEVYLPDGTNLPVLCLQGRLDAQLISRYSQLTMSHETIACAAQWKGSFPPTAWHMLERAAAERLEKRTAYLLKLVDARQGDWEAASWLWLARAFGQRVNADAFEQLAASIPWKLVQRYAHAPLQLEAVLLGQAGMLSEEMGPHQTLLRNEYRYLSHKHGLQPAIGLHWRKLRMYPAGFPVNRLRQLLQFVQLYPRLLSDLLEANELRQLRVVFQQLGTATARPGRASADRWLINAAIPLVFAYGHYHQLPALTEKALLWLEEIKPEDNHITRRYQNLGLKAVNALHSQGILELHAVYCNPKRCLDCLIGNHWLLKKPP